MTTPKAAPPPPPKPPMSEPMTDTASRRSMAEKWSMFENQTSPEKQQEEIEPTNLPLSERIKLFNKNRTAPKPVARFGDAVTPSMLQHGQGRINSQSQSPTKPKQLFPATPKMGRKSRSPSPVRKMQRSPSPVRKTQQNNSPVKMSLKEEWRKPKSPTQQMKKRESSPQTSPTNYPGMNSLKRVKVSPPKPGQLYPQLASTTDSEPEHDRPESSMSAAPSEAPSLGAAIKRAATAYQ